MFLLSCLPSHNTYATNTHPTRLFQLCTPSCPLTESIQIPFTLVSCLRLAETVFARHDDPYPNLSEVATKLGPSQKLSTLLLQKLAQDHLHIIIQMPAGTHSGDIAIPLASRSPLTQKILSKSSSSTCPESDLPSKTLRTGEWLRRSSCYHPTHVLSLHRLRVVMYLTRRHPSRRRDV